MLKKPKLLVVGSFAMDLIVTAPRFPTAGETVPGCAYRTAPGGKGANQAVQAARLGADVTMAGRVGRDSFGRELMESAKAAGVDVSHVAVDPHHSTAVSNIQIEAKPGSATQNRIIAVPGANWALTPADIAFLKKDISQYDMVLLQSEIPLSINTLVAEYAKSAGVPVMLNPAPSAPLPDALLDRLSYISPNEYECADLTGITVRTEDGEVNRDGLRAAAGALRARGVENVIITLGGGGSVLVNENGLIHMPCVPNVCVQDPTAAGDSFVGAFCTGVSAGLNHAQALDFATHAAAITVSRMGAQPSLPTLAEMRECLDHQARFDMSGLLDALA